MHNPEITVDELQERLILDNRPSHEEATQQASYSARNTIRNRWHAGHTELLRPEDGSLNGAGFHHGSKDTHGSAVTLKIKIVMFCLLCGTTVNAGITNHSHPESTFSKSQIPSDVFAPDKLPVLTGAEPTSSKPSSDAFAPDELSVLIGDNYVGDMTVPVPAPVLLSDDRLSLSGCNKIECHELVHDLSCNTCLGDHCGACCESAETFGGGGMVGGFGGVGMGGGHGIGPGTVALPWSASSAFLHDDDQPNPVVDFPGVGDGSGNGNQVIPEPPIITWFVMIGAVYVVHAWGKLLLKDAAVMQRHARR